MNIRPTPESLKNLCDTCQWSRGDVAKMLHVSERTVGSWENGETEMHAAHFHLLTIFAIYKMSENESPTPIDIKNLRMSLGLNQNEFAKMMSSSPRRVSGWEIGETTPHHGLWRAMRVFSALEDPTSISAG